MPRLFCGFEKITLPVVQMLFNAPPFFSSSFFFWGGGGGVGHERSVFASPEEQNESGRGKPLGQL